MERNEFLKSLGLGLAVVCGGSCLESCGSKSSDPAPNNGGGTGGPAVGSKVNVDLSTQLMTVGSSTTSGGVLFIRLASGNATSSFAATQATCPHQGAALNWLTANSLIQCQLHSSQYTSAGAVLRQPSDGGMTTALKVYQLAVNGTTLTATIA